MPRSPPSEEKVPAPLLMRSIFNVVAPLLHTKRSTAPSPVTSAHVTPKPASCPATPLEAAASLNIPVPSFKYNKFWSPSPVVTNKSTEPSP